MFDNKITTYEGMEDYYFFIDPNNLITKKDTRNWVERTERPLLVNYYEHFRDFNYKYWLCPDYKSKFKNNILIYMFNLFNYS